MWHVASGICLSGIVRQHGRQKHRAFEFVISAHNLRRARGKIRRHFLVAPHCSSIMWTYVVLFSNSKTRWSHLHLVAPRSRAAVFMLPRTRDKLRGRAIPQSGGGANMARQRQTMVAGVALEGVIGSIETFLDKAQSRDVVGLLKTGGGARIWAFIASSAIWPCGMCAVEARGHAGPQAFWAGGSS